MTTNDKYFTNNALIYLGADFLWNLARTFPHAILTILLLNMGVALEEIAFLQIVYMIMVIFGEFPSGVISDHCSRKLMYLLSVSMIAVAYFMIFISNGNLIILAVSWGLYGLSVAIKSGTLDNEIILEYRDENKNLKRLIACESYMNSISSIVGAFIGSICYRYVGINIYVVIVVLFLISLIITLLYRPKSDMKKERIEFKEFINEIKLGIRLFFVRKDLKLIIFMFAFSAFFSQTLFQYWQVLYENHGVAVSLFGYVYVILQIANMIGTFIYKKISHLHYTMIFILILIPMATIFILRFCSEILFFITFPLIVILFYIYNQFVNVLMKEKSPKEYISTFTSLIGSCINLISILSLLIISCLFALFTVSTVYIIMFLIFSVSSICCVISYLRIK